MITCPSLHSHQFRLIGKQTNKTIHWISVPKHRITSPYIFHTFNQSVAITISGSLFAFFIVCIFYFFMCLIVHLFVKSNRIEVLADALYTMKMCCAVGKYEQPVYEQTEKHMSSHFFWWSKMLLAENESVNFRIILIKYLLTSRITAAC